MVTLSWALGRRYYPVPYDLKRIIGYIGLGLGLFAAARALDAWLGVPPLAAGVLCLAVYLGMVWWLDGRPLRQRLGG
jgi:hypothetical protein